MSDLVSIIIPTYNRRKDLMNCIDSFINSTYKNLEIIVVDNASTDDTIEYLLRLQKEQRCNLVIVQLKKNMMATGGRNAGIDVAKGDYILFCDNDNIVEPEMISTMLEDFLADKTIGYVGALSIQEYNKSIWSASSTYNFFTSMPRNLYGGQPYSTTNLQRIYETNYSQNVSMIKKSILKQVGHFDEVIFAMYDEADFGYRVKKTGCRMIIDTQAITHHLGRAADDDAIELRRLGIEQPERAYHFAKNRSIFMRKFAPKGYLITYYLFFIHLFNMYYCMKAIKNKRLDIAKAFFIGTYKGPFIKIDKNIYL